MFNSIVESVLNEITATDAYTKYYSDLPKEEFFGLANMYGKYDNVLKMVMDCIRDGYNTFADGRVFIEKLSKADNNVRMEFLKSFRLGEIDNIDEADAYIDMISESGCESDKSLYTKGLLVLSDDEESTITCTATYAANHHYYGNTHWCTASDRKGNYDGWAMFLNYVFRGKYVMSDYGRGELNCDAITDCLIQYVDHKTGKIYQFQMDKRCTIGEMCDEEDVKLSNLPDPPYEIVSFITQFMKAHIEQCFKMTSELLDKEAKYMLYKEMFDRRKEIALRKKASVMKNKLSTKALNINKKKAEFVTRKYNEVIHSNLLYNYEFIKEIIDKSWKVMRDYDTYSFVPTKEYIDEAEKFFMSHGYLYTKKARNNKTLNGITYYVMFPILGLIKRVDADYEKGEASLKDLFEPWFYHENSFFLNNGDETYEEVRTHGGICVFLDEKEGKVISVFSAERCMSINSLIPYSYSQELRDIVVIRNQKIEKGPFAQTIYNIKTGEKLDLPDTDIGSEVQYAAGIDWHEMPPGYVMFGGELQAAPATVPNVNLISLKGLKFLGLFYGNILGDHCGYFLHSDEYGYYLVTNNTVAKLNYGKNTSEKLYGLLSKDGRYLGIFENNVGLEVYDLESSKVAFDGEFRLEGYDSNALIIVVRDKDGCEVKIQFMLNSNAKRR